MSFLSFRSSGLHIALEDNRRADFIHQRLVPTLFLFQTAVNHRLMRQDRRESFIVILNRHVRICLPPPVDKLLHPLEILTRLPVWLIGFPYHDALNGLPAEIICQIIEQRRSRNSRQSAGNNLQRIGDCQSCTLLSVIY